MTNAEMKTYSLTLGTHGTHGFVQNSAEFSRQITEVILESF